MFFSPSLPQVLFFGLVLAAALSMIVGTCIVPFLWRENGYLSRRRRFRKS